jgi:hypothetical protein
MTANEPEPYVTKTGRVLTDAEIQALANEAERGYTVEQMLEKQPTRAKPFRRGETSPCGELAPHTMHLWMQGKNFLFCQGVDAPAP